MRHAILGAGGVGLLIGGALAQSGQPVLLILTQRSFDEYPGGIHLESPALGELDVDVPASTRLDREVDVIWLAVKAAQLEEAIQVASPAVAPRALVVPLLNGIDHVKRLRDVYGDQVIPAAIRVESERVGPGHVIQATVFASTELAPPPALLSHAEKIAEELRTAGLACTVSDDEGRVLWGKLALLGPMALGTSLTRQPIGGARSDPQVFELMLAAVREVCAVAASEGVALNPEIYTQALRAAPDHMRSSMQKDLEAGRPLELDAIAGPVLRRGRERGIPTPAIEELARRVGGSTL